MVKKGQNNFRKLIQGKRVLFITTKNIDYIRNTQEIRILQENAKYIEIIYSDKKNYALRILSVWNQVSRKKVADSDVVFCGFEPQFVVPFVGRKLKNKTIIIDFFVSVYDTLVCDRKKIKARSLIARFCHYVDKKTLEAADCVISDTMAHAQYFISEFGGNKDIFETLYLEADSKIYFPRQQKKPDSLKDKLVVLYFGSILPLQGIDVILDSIRMLKDRSDICFDIIGPIPDKYNKPLQGNVKYTNWLSQEELAERIAQADLCLAGHFSGNIEKARRTIAGKTYIYDMMDKTMILGKGEANYELFREDSKHRFVEMGNARELANRIMEYKI